MKTADKKEKLLKAKIAVALQHEYQRVPTADEIEKRLPLNPGYVQGSPRVALQTSGPEKKRPARTLLTQPYADWLRPRFNP